MSIQRELTWNNILDNWENGVPHTYPSRMKDSFFWNTSVLSNKGNTPFLERFRTCNELPKRQSYTSFQKHIDKYKDTHPYAISFNNISGDTRLIIPAPVKGKSFPTMKKFIDNASRQHQIEFWKYVAKEVKKEMKQHSELYISTHGLGVPYFHVRICTTPKYYFITHF